MANMNPSLCGHDCIDFGVPRKCVPRNSRGSPPQFQPWCTPLSSARCHTIVGHQWSLRNTARPRRSPAMPAPGSAFMILARPMAVH